MDRPDKVLYKSNMPRVMQKPTIRSYNLFGEVRDLPDVVHCETIAARSVLHDWELQPHRHARLHQILLVARGGGVATLETQQYRLRPMDAINVPTGRVHGFKFKPGTQGWVVTVATEILDEALTLSEDLGRILSKPAVFRGSPLMRDMMTGIFAEYNARHFARAHVLRALSATLLGLVARALANDHIPSSPAPGVHLVRRFEALIDAHYLEHWPVARYAGALTITPTHLTRLARENYGCPATHIIRDRIVREARRSLVYTNLSISTIAYTLGYDDPAYFSRVFAQATGLSPSEFRNRVHGSGPQPD